MSDTPSPTPVDRWKGREILAATVTLKHRETGEEIGPIIVPYEGDTPPPEEELYQQAWELYNTAEHIRAQIREEDIEALATNLQTGEYGKWFAQMMRDLVRENLTVSATPSESDTSEDLAEGEETAEEIRAMLRDRSEMIVNAYLEASPFWRDFAHDALTHAWSWALDDLRTEYPDPGTITDEEFDTALRARYREGGYLAGAMMNLMPGWAELLWAGIAAGFKQEDGTPGPLAQRIEELARMRVRTRQPSPPIMRPIFDPTGYGYSPSDGISAGATRALLGPGGAWKPRDDGYPEFRHTWGGNSLAWYSPDSGMFPTPEDALKAVECLSDGHVDAFQYMTSKWLANRDRANRGPFDGVYISADEFLDDRGISRHKQGTHKPENVSEVAQQIRELSRFLVSGSVEGPPKRGKRAAVTIAAPLIVVSQYVKRPRLDGSEEEIGWYLRPGDWAATMQDLSPQYAVTTQALFQLHSRRDYMAKRIGRYLLQQFRYRASKGTYTQPFYIETILEGARIDITTSDRKNPGRFRERIEGSLQTLTKTEAPVIKRWRYLDKVPETGRGMLEQWLRARIVCTPADGLTSRYAEITEKGKAGRARALKGGRRGT
jgi:hypothetical protein